MKGKEVRRYPQFIAVVSYFLLQNWYHLTFYLFFATSPKPPFFLLLFLFFTSIASIFFFLFFLNIYIYIYTYIYLKLHYIAIDICSYLILYSLQFVVRSILRTGRRSPCRTRGFFLFLYSSLFFLLFLLLNFFFLYFLVSYSIFIYLVIRLFYLLTAIYDRRYTARVPF